MLNLKIYSPSVFIIIYVLCQACYQQHFVFAETSDCDNNYTFCIGNHHTAMIKIFQTFLQETQTNCEFNIKNLLILYINLRKDCVKDCYNLLLRREVRKYLIKFMITKVEKIFEQQSWSQNEELEQILKNIYDIDKSAGQIILEQVISNLWLSKEPEEIINGIGDLKEPKLKLMAFKFLLDKYLLDNEQAITLMPLLTFHVGKFYNKEIYSYTQGKDLQDLYDRFPKKLRMFYESSDMYSFFHIYRTQKNNRSPHFWTFNNNGLVAFTYNTGHLDEYVYVENHGLSYGLPSAIKSSQWWHVIFTSAGYLMFCNDDSKDLLCAEKIADDIKFTLLNYKNNMNNIACKWKDSIYASGILLVSPSVHNDL